VADLAKYVVQLEAETAKYQKNLERAQRQLAKFNKDQRGMLDKISAGFKRLAQTSTVALTALGAAYVRNAKDLDRLAKAARTADIGSATFQKWEFAATQAGVATTEFSAAVGRANRRIGLFATDGSGPAAKAFQQLGIQVRDAGGALKSNERIIRDYVKSLENVATQSERTAFITALFGDDFRKGALLFGQGTEALQGFERQAESLGIVIESKVLKQAEAFNDQMDTLGRILQARVSASFSGLSPAIIQSGKALADFLKDAEGANSLMRGLGEVLKLSTELAIRSGTAFGNLGRSIAAMSVAAKEAVSGNFDAVSAVIKKVGEDADAANAKMERLVENLRSAGGGLGELGGQGGNPLAAGGSTGGRSTGGRSGS